MYQRDLDAGAYADLLGMAKAAEKDAKDRSEELKAILIETAAVYGAKSFAGQFYRATVSFVTRNVTDWKEVQDRLLKAGVEAKVLAKAIADSTAIVEGLPVVRVSSL